MPPSAIPTYVTRDLLQNNALQWPDLKVLVFDSGPSFTTVELLQAVREQAAGLQALGVTQDDYVLSWMPNGPAAVLGFLALNYLGAVCVPINTAYKGRLLEHVIHNSGARLMLGDGRLLERLQHVDTGKLQQIVVSGAERPQLPGIELLDEGLLAGDAATLQPPSRPLQPWDTQCVIFTSGTTGPSKGVLCSYRHTWTAASEFRHVGPGDCNLVALPMFHIGGILGINFALIHGGTAAFVERFRTDAFWDTVKRLEVTAVGLLGTMVQFLMQQPVQPGERIHPIKKAVIAPFGDIAIAFGKRFGIDTFTEFNMTELSVPLWCGPNHTLPGTCGKPRAGLELRLVDAMDQPVPTGNIGELILRCDEPWTLSHGYHNNPEATAATWRNGWFHTGDLFYHDAEQNYFYVDRMKDMIRRRGENISSFEVEAELLALPGVKAAAAVAVPGDGGEDEVLAVVSPQPGITLDPAAMLQQLEPRMARFMLPRYFRIMDELPLTPTQKIEKHVLRSAGLTPDTWDREAAGQSLKGQHLDVRSSPPVSTGTVNEHFSANAEVSSSATFPDGKKGASSGTNGITINGTPLPAKSGKPDNDKNDNGTPTTTKSQPAHTNQPDTRLPSGPLIGLKVLEFAGLGPAPFCSMLLSDMGADVVRIDRPGKQYSRFDVEARGRTSLALDLKSLEGKAQALQLVSKASILIEGYRPGVMERLGLGPDSALQLNPQLVYGRMTGWGQTGPMSHKAGHDLNYLALSGALHAMGTADKPAIPLNLIADFGGGALYLAMGLLAALRHAEHSGKGQVIDCSMTEGVISMLNMIYGGFADQRWTDQRESNVIDGGAPFYNVYRCMDDKWLAFAGIEAQFYSSFITASGLPASLLELQWQKDQWPAQQQVLQKYFAQNTRDFWVEYFAEADICLTPVLSLAEAQHHPHNLKRQSFIQHSGIIQAAPAPGFSITPGSIQNPDPASVLSVETIYKRWSK